MNEYSIRVLLVDENVLSFSKYRSIAEDLGISLERFTYWDHAKDALDKDFDNWSAIVLEPYSKLHSGGYNNIKQFLVHALSDISAISTKNNKIIPWYIFTDRKPEEFIDLILESRKSFDADWHTPYYTKENDAQMLFKRIKICANQAKGLQLRNQLYPELFRSIDYLEKYGLNYEVGYFMEDFLLSLHFGHMQESDFRKIRMTIEYIFQSMVNNRLIPYIQGRGGMLNIFASCQIAANGEWEDPNSGVNYKCDKVIDNLLRDVLTQMINISNASLHTSSEYTQNRRHYHLSEYQDNVKSNYLLHSCSMQLCDVLIYYANILKNKNINN